MGSWSLDLQRRMSQTLKPEIISKNTWAEAAGVPTLDRLKLVNLIRDLTASDFGGYNELLAIHAEGSLEAQKITIYREYDLERCKSLAKQAAGIGEHAQ